MIFTFLIQPLLKNEILPDQRQISDVWEAESGRTGASAAEPRAVQTFKVGTKWRMFVQSCFGAGRSET